MRIDIGAEQLILFEDMTKPNNIAIRGSVGRTFETFRYDYIIEDRQKFDKAVTKYCIMRNK